MRYKKEGYDLEIENGSSKYICQLCPDYHSSSYSTMYKHILTHHPAIKKDKEKIQKNKVVSKNQLERTEIPPGFPLSAIPKSFLRERGILRDYYDDEERHDYEEERHQRFLMHEIKYLREKQRRRDEVERERQETERQSLKKQYELLQAQMTQSQNQNLQERERFYDSEIERIQKERLGIEEKRREIQQRRKIEVPENDLLLKKPINPVNQPVHQSHQPVVSGDSTPQEIANTPDTGPKRETPTLEKDFKELSKLQRDTQIAKNVSQVFESILKKLTP